LFAKIAGDDGLMDVTEFAKIPALSRAPQEAIERLFGLLDADGDGTVDLETFLAGVRGVPPVLPPVRPPSLPGRP
jgi:Ca2+-binding EF-hand superfamily protein